MWTRWREVGDEFRTAHHDVGEKHNDGGPGRLLACARAWALAREEIKSLFVLARPFFFRSCRGKVISRKNTSPVEPWPLVVQEKPSLVRYAGRAQLAIQSRTPPTNCKAAVAAGISGSAGQVRSETCTSPTVKLRHAETAAPRNRTREHDLLGSLSRRRRVGRGRSVSTRLAITCISHHQLHGAH
jgi:hypothetical protein